MGVTVTVQPLREWNEGEWCEKELGRERNGIGEEELCHILNSGQG